MKSYQLFRILYISTILVNSLFYSFTTIQYVALNGHYLFAVILLSSLVDLFVLWDSVKSKVLVERTPKYFTRIATITLCVLAFCNQLYFSKIVLLFSFFVINLFLSIFILNINTHYLKSRSSIYKGLTHLSTYTMISKTIGFALGAYLMKFHWSIYYILIAAVFIMGSFFDIDNRIEETIQMANIKGSKHLSVLLVYLCMSPIALFWMPTFVQYLKQTHMDHLSALVFSLLGALTILYLKWVHPKTTAIFTKLKLYVFFGLLFLDLEHSHQLFLFKIVVFSIFIATSISLGIAIRSDVITANQHIPLKNMVQTLSTLSSVGTILFSILGKSITNMPNIITVVALCLSIVVWMHYRQRGDREK